MKEVKNKLINEKNKTKKHGIKFQTCRVNGSAVVEIADRDFSTGIVWTFRKEEQRTNS